MYTRRKTVKADSPFICPRGPCVPPPTMLIVGCCTNPPTSRPSPPFLKLVLEMGAVTSKALLFFSFFFSPVLLPLPPLMLFLYIKQSLQLTLNLDITHCTCVRCVSPGSLWTDGLWTGPVCLQNSMSFVRHSVACCTPNFNLSSSLPNSLE